MIVVRYRDMDITYLEIHNEWAVTVDGLQRRFNSLAVAKAAVDTAIDAEDSVRGFVRFALDKKMTRA